MGGAYVAKPAVEPDPPVYPDPGDIPPGWNPIWPFPGAFPPGYEPELTLPMDAPSEMRRDVPVGIATILKDHVDYVTNEPTANMTFSASWQDTGIALDLTIGGTEPLGSIAIICYSDVGDDFWGSDMLIEFDLTIDDEGRTFDLIVNSTPFENCPDRSVSSHAEITVLRCEVNLEYQQTTEGVFPEIRDFCIDYVTNGMRILAENASAGEGGWEVYVDTQIADICNAPRFWAWTQYPEMGVMAWTTVGVIDKYGVAKYPLGSEWAGWGWYDSVQFGPGIEKWWLVQFVQERRAEGEVTSATKPIFGTFHWMAYSITQRITCTMEQLFDPEECYPIGPKLWHIERSTIDTCLGTDEVWSITDQVVCGGVPAQCTPLWPEYPEGMGIKDVVTEYAEEDDPISEGEDFFKTWDYYIALLYPEGY